MSYPRTVEMFAPRSLACSWKTSVMAVPKRSWGCRMAKDVTPSSSQPRINALVWSAGLLKKRQASMPSSSTLGMKVMNLAERCRPASRIFSQMSLRRGPPMMGTPLTVRSSSRNVGDSVLMSLISGAAVCARFSRQALSAPLAIFQPTLE